MKVTTEGSGEYLTVSDAALYKVPAESRMASSSIPCSSDMDVKEGVIGSPLA